MNQEAAWIQELKARDAAKLKEDRYALATTDRTVVHPEKVQLDKAELVFEIELIKEGRRNSPTLTWNITPPQQLSAAVLPEAAHNKNYIWSVSDQDVVSVDHGLVTARQEAQWIQALNGKEGSKETVVTATTEDGGIQGICKVLLHYKTTDRTYSSSGSGSSCGGGGGSSSGSGRPKTTTMAGPAGTWIQDSTGWWFQYKDGSYPKDTWVQLGYNGNLEWYHFDGNGYMQTGWFTDIDGNRYFLHNVSDGTQGCMVTGWNLLEGKWYYFNPISDGTRGALYVNCTTPDGYVVGADGVWQP